METLSPTEIIEELKDVTSVVIDLDLIPEEYLDILRQVLESDDRFQRFNIAHYELYLAERIRVWRNYFERPYYANDPTEYPYETISREEYLERFKSKKIFYLEG